jgi:glycosyltransferase involved in cell wall biosynthesis
MSKKCLIISPINQWGGVNLDVGFIAQSMMHRDHDVFILSVGTYYNDCSLFDFIDTSSYDSVDRILYKNNFLINYSLQLLGIVKPMSIPLHQRLNNVFTKSFINIYKKRLSVLEQYISRYDKVILCSQLTGTWNEEVVKIATRYNKPIYIRVTQQIAPHHIATEKLSWLKEVSHFIHHSKRNLDILAEVLPENGHSIIDQCAMWEDQFLSIPIIEKPSTEFYCISRLEQTKCIDKIIEAFKSIKDPTLSLHIYGDGSLRTTLEELATDDTRIHFYGVVALQDIAKIHGTHDCLLIASSIEGGPYTAIEAMAGGRLIVSTNVGAMVNRLGQEYPFFVNEEKEITLTKLIRKIANLTSEETQQLSTQLRDIYKNTYSVSEIEKAYGKAILG